MPRANSQPSDLAKTAFRWQDRNKHLKATCCPCLFMLSSFSRPHSQALPPFWRSWCITPVDMLRYSLWFLIHGMVICLRQQEDKGKKKNQLAILNQQQVENLQLNFSQWNTCNFIGTFAIEKSQNASCHHCQNYYALIWPFCFIYRDRLFFIRT